MNDKTIQRQSALAARRGLSQTQRAACSGAICERLKTLPAVLRAGTILSYQAMPDEVELTLFHRWARAEGKTLAYPVTEGAGAMEAYAPETADDLAPGQFNILAPVPARSRLVLADEIDLVLVPCVAFDRDGGRLGWGGGYYDRYLPRCPQALRVAVAFEVQGLSRVVRDSHDEPVAMIVTEKDIYHSKGLCT